MGTTALAVELLVIGYQALIWLAIIVCLFFKCDTELLNTLKDWKELSIVASVAIAFTLGAIINGIMAKLMDSADRKWIFKHDIKPSEMRAYILVNKPAAFPHIIENLIIPRLLRSTIFNIIMIGILTFFYLATQDATFTQLLIVVILFGVVSAFAAWAWYETSENYYIHLCETYKASKSSLI